MIHFVHPLGLLRQGYSGFWLILPSIGIACNCRRNLSMTIFGICFYGCVLHVFLTLEFIAREFSVLPFFRSFFRLHFLFLMLQREYAAVNGRIFQLCFAHCDEIIRYMCCACSNQPQSPQHVYVAVIFQLPFLYECMSVCRIHFLLFVVCFSILYSPLLILLNNVTNKQQRKK